MSKSSISAWCRAPVAVCVLAAALVAGMPALPRIAIAQGDGAGCIQPSAPIYRAREPRLPSCLDLSRNSNTCHRAETRRFLLDYINFQYDIDDYLKEMQEYLEKSIEYNECVKSRPGEAGQ